MNLAYLDTINTVQVDIASVLKVLSQTMRLDARVSHIDYENAAPINLSFQACMAYYKEYLAKQPPITNPVSRLTSMCERNDIVLCPDHVEVLAEPDDVEALKKGSYSTKLGIVVSQDIKDADILSLVAAEILAYTTTQDDKGVIGNVFDMNKAKKMRVPYLFPVGARNVVAVGGLQAGQTRDVIYEKLRKNWRVAVQILDSIYSQPDFQKFGAKDDVILNVYNNGTNVKPKSELWLPCAQDLEIGSTTVLDTAWRFVSDSRGVRGEDNRGIGPISIGYMWYDMDRSMFVDLAMVQDLLSVAKAMGARAVRSEELGVRVVKMLVANGLSVYSTRATELEQDPHITGFYLDGNRTFFRYVDYNVSSPTVRQKVIDYGDIKDKLQALKKHKLVAAHMYLHPTLKEDKQISLFPSFRVHSGMVLVGLKGKNSYSFDSLVSRFFEANHVRNNFPYSRLAYCVMDAYFNYFQPRIIVPRNLPRVVQIADKDLEFRLHKALNKKVDLSFDIELVEQVELLNPLEEMTQLFYGELKSSKNVNGLLWECICYPKLKMSSEYFGHLKLLNPRYDVFTDSHIADTYPKILKDLAARKDAEAVDEEDDEVDLNAPSTGTFSALKVAADESSDSDEDLNIVVKKIKVTPKPDN